MSALPAIAKVAAPVVLPALAKTLLSGKSKPKPKMPHGNGNGNGKPVSAAAKTSQVLSARAHQKKPPVAKRSNLAVGKKVIGAGIRHYGPGLAKAALGSRSQGGKVLRKVVRGAGRGTNILKTASKYIKPIIAAGSLAKTAASAL